MIPTSVTYGSARRGRVTLRGPMAAHVLRELLLQERADRTTWFALYDRAADSAWVRSVTGPAFPEGRRGGGWTYQQVSGGAAILDEGPSREEAEAAVTAFRREQ